MSDYFRIRHALAASGNGKCGLRRAPYSEWWLIEGPVGASELANELGKGQFSGDETYDGHSVTANYEAWTRDGERWTIHQLSAKLTRLLYRPAEQPKDVKLSDLKRPGYLGLATPT